MIINVSSGLASRMISITHAYCLCKEWNDNLVIYWPLEDCCAIGYYDVFERSQFEDINVSVYEYDLRIKMDVNQIGIRKNLKKLRIDRVLKEIIGFIRIRRQNKKFDKIAEKNEYIDYYPSTWEGGEPEKHAKRCWNTLLKAREDNKNCFLNIYCGIMPEMESKKQVQYSEIIKIREDYIQRAKNVLDGHDCIGFHIRRTDHKVAMSVSTVESFVKKIEDTLKNENNQMFYLSTDDQEVERQLLSAYGEHIIVQNNKAWGRGKLTGMESAIIDMLCLSMCEKIYGSHGSAFSLFSAGYGAIELEICGESKKN